MRTASILVTAVVVAGAFAPASAQSGKQPKTITLSGCVQRDEKKPGEFTLTDKKKTYRLSGANFEEYVGRRVQVDGGVVVKNVRIAGGLQPNPNIAAQAGALDPSRAAVQAATTGPVRPPSKDPEEFQVDAIRSAVGPCQ